MSRYFRVFSFMGQVLGMIKQNKTLLSPLALNMILAIPAMIVFTIIYHFTQDSALGYVVAAVGLTGLYFIDYFCNGLTVSLIYDQVTTGKAEFQPALSRTFAASPGILIFAAISAAFELMATYARERDDILGSILAGIVRAVWTAATYVVMPAMVIENTGFFNAFKRSKDLAANDPTQVGSGIIGMGLATYILGVVCWGLGVGSFNVLGNFSPLLGMFAMMFFVNIYWALGGYLKITYFTCFYLWARECERQGSADPRLAPAPLAAAMAS